MWQRRMELEFLLPVAFSFRHLHPGAKTIEPVQVGEWGEMNQGQGAASFMSVPGSVNWPIVTLWPGMSLPLPILRAWLPASFLNRPVCAFLMTARICRPGMTGRRQGPALHLTDPRVKRLASGNCGNPACRICIDEPTGQPLPHEPNPVAVLSTSAKIVICGQAPGNKVHHSGSTVYRSIRGPVARMAGGRMKTNFTIRTILRLFRWGSAFPAMTKRAVICRRDGNARRHWHDGFLPPCRNCRSNCWWAAAPRNGILKERCKEDA